MDNGDSNGCAVIVDSQKEKTEDKAEEYLKELWLNYLQMWWKTQSIYLKKIN